MTSRIARSSSTTRINCLLSISISVWNVVYRFLCPLTYPSPRQWSTHNCVLHLCNESGDPA